jgi:hypothetical protein
MSEEGIEEGGDRAKAGYRVRYRRGIKCDLGGRWLGSYSPTPKCDNWGCHCPMNRGDTMDQGIGSVQMTNKPRRPRKVESGHITGTVEAEAGRRESAQGAIIPRLFNLDTAAAYLSMSPWTIRDLEAAGVLPRVRVPLPQGGELRKLLFDKADLDRLIGAWKEAAG